VGSVRAPAVAGQFYPANPQTLAGLVDSMLDAAPLVAESVAPAYVVPHAGYRYSGPTAAFVYGRLRAHADEVRRIVLIGPAHFAPLRGCATPSTLEWSTPLGRISIDAEGCAALARDGHATVDDGPHTTEHSLEVQLPFLQRSLRPDVVVLPVVVGASTVDEVAEMITAAVGDGPEGTVVLCSTDLSHYLDEATARRQDERTVEAVLGRSPDEIGVRDACGVFALRGLVAWAARENLKPHLLYRCTSADTAGDPARVVGYAALAIR
jgi:MEMO1 family protein